MIHRRAPLPGALALLVVTLGCAEAEPPPAESPRDWSAHPAIVETDAPAVLYALSDIHGGYDRAVALLVANGLLEGIPSEPSAAVWAGGQATLVVIGDMFDKGPQGLEVIDLLRGLQPTAAAAGGRVVVLMGNHEAEFLADPENDRASKADGINQEIKARGLRPYDVASRADPRGRFLRDLPFAARIGGWFFLHSGDTHGRSLAQLSSAIRDAVDTQGYGAQEIVGPDSLLESIGWFRAGEAVAQQYAQTLGVAHIVFGHDPGGLGVEKSTIARDGGGVAFRIDCGLSPNIDYSDGKLLRVTRTADLETADSLDLLGELAENKTIWSGPL